jgi:AcrR family transcriptional regulator
MPSSTAAPEASRADARRNRAKVLDAAQRAFAREGLSVSLGEIARRAGVGAGTVYRHFPTKEVLLEAVLSQRVERLARLATDHSRAQDPGTAFVDFVIEVVTSTPANRDFCELLESKDGWPRAVLLTSGQRFAVALEQLLAAAQQAGAVRPDLDVAGMQALFTGCVAMQRLQSDPRKLAPMVALVIDAMLATSTVTKAEVADKFRDETSTVAEQRNASIPAPERPGCEVCGEPLMPSGMGRPARFCGAACRQKAYRRRLRSAA